MHVFGLWEESGVAEGSHTHAHTGKKCKLRTEKKQTFLPLDMPTAAPPCVSACIYIYISSYDAFFITGGAQNK